MDSILDLVRTLFSAERLRELLTTTLSGWPAYATLFAIVFAETGLLIGFLLPGDSLLFVVGVIAGAGGLNIWLINGLLIVAAILGDATGYLLGKRAGPAIFNRPDSRFFKQEHLRKTQAFYEKHGGKTIIYARFIPIIRTFAPFVAGVAQMSYARFASFNVFGGIGWVASMTLLGYFIGDQEIVRKNLEKVIIGIVLLSAAPVIFEAFKSWREGKR
jgi:membrane-associated protein